MGNPSREVPSHAPTLVMDRLECEVEELLAHCFVKHEWSSQHAYLVKWKDFPEMENSWEWQEALQKYVEKM